MKNIILVCGKKRSGKDTFFNILDLKYPEKFARVKFTAPIYETAKTAFGYTINDNNKETIDEILNITPRHWMQEYGDMMKFICGDDIFAKLACDNIYKTDAETIIITDCRFQEEIDFVRKIFQNVTSVLIKRDKIISTDNHVSEKLNLQTDYVLENNGSLEDYVDKVYSWYKMHENKI